MSEATIDAGVTPYGTRKQIHVSDDTIIEQNTFDAEPVLQAAKEARELTEGQRWGDGKVIGKVPMHIYAQCAVMSKQDQHNFLLDYLRANPAFIAFGKFK
jgi:hypothetical protein